MIGEVPEVEGKGRLKTEVFKSFLDKIYEVGNLAAVYHLA